MSPSKTHRKVATTLGMGKNPSVFQAKNDQSLGFHGLGQPGPARGSIGMGQMFSVETRQMSQQQSSVLSQQQTSVLSQQQTSILSQQKTRQLLASGRLL